MKTGDFEGTAERLYLDAGLDPRAPAPALALIEGLVGRGNIRMVPPTALSCDAALVRVRSEWRIYIRNDLHPKARRFAAMHELAHLELGLRAPESHCDALAAALIAPRPAFERAVRDVGHELPALARCFATTESCVGMRLGEALAKPVALVGVDGDILRVRGPAFDWPPASKLRAIAHGAAHSCLKRARLSDAPRVLVSAS